MIIKAALSGAIGLTVVQNAKEAYVKTQALPSTLKRARFSGKAADRLNTNPTDFQHRTIELVTVVRTTGKRPERRALIQVEFARQTAATAA